MRRRGRRDRHAPASMTRRVSVPPPQCVEVTQSASLFYLLPSDAPFLIGAAAFACQHARLKATVASICIRHFAKRKRKYFARANVPHRVHKSPEPSALRALHYLRARGRVMARARRVIEPRGLCAHIFRPEIALFVIAPTSDDFVPRRSRSGTREDDLPGLGAVALLRQLGVITAILRFFFIYQQHMSG